MSSILSLKSRGRGRNYSRTRGVLESTLRVLYAGGWPAALWRLSGLDRRVELIQRTFAIRPAGRPVLRVAFMSDLHLGPTTSVRTVERACAILDAARPDVLLLGGDYIYLDTTRDRARTLERCIGGIRAPLKLAVFGNHDLWANHDSIADALAAAGARLLVNAAAVLDPPHDDVAVVGLDDPSAGRIDAQRAFAGAAGAETIIALCHAPDGLLACGENRFGIYLCGHTHGGQIAAPWGPIVTSHGRLTRKYSAGFFSAGGRLLFVSRGIGAVEAPVRLFAPPDAAVVDLAAPGGAPPPAAGGGSGSS